MGPNIHFCAILSFLCIVFHPSEGVYTQNSFQLSFPLQQHSAYARLQNTVPFPLHEFTLCHWTKMQNVSQFGSIFSYASSDEYPNELVSIITKRGANLVNRREWIFETNSTVPFNKWTHYCTTWSAYSQEFKAFRNGKEVPGSLRGLPHSNPVLPAGVVIIGQHQSTLGGTFQLIRSFNGDISEVHLWDYVLCQEQISRLSLCREPTLEGNVISWRKSLFTFSGPIVMGPVTLCGESC